MEQLTDTLTRLLNLVRVTHPNEAAWVEGRFARKGRRWNTVQDDLCALAYSGRLDGRFVKPLTSLAAAFRHNAQRNDKGVNTVDVDNYRDEALAVVDTWLEGNNG